ncbi:hypothetical protein DFH08DRAFT_926720 [Mycena albidolilacea]|uniref:DUF6589 domain-containing protein n=1 Tax=Mycena albidolilacea TaxID=1033008 RepID=A0AAD6ZF02_9AGAR|nr:hypothetical protein DFH08DRAFT_926720 [Mycena albidolilacea]
MPKLKGRRILSSDGGSPPTALSDDELDAAPGPETPTRALSDDEESGRRTPLPSLETYMCGGSEDSGSEGSGNEDEAPQNSALPVLPPLSSDGLIHTSPVVSTKEQKKAKKREKGAKKRKETMANKQSASAASAEERKAAVFEEVLETLSSNGLSFGQLMLYVFDPIYKQGVVRWNGFFKHQGLATQVLNLWMSNQNSPLAQQEVGTWAEDYVAEVMHDEAQGITESKKLQTADTAINNDYVTNFSMLSMGTYFQTAARISMKVLVAFATSPRNLKSGLVQRAGKHFTIITAAALSLLGEFSHKNNFSCRIMGLYLYATGAQCQTISVMSHLGISESYQNLIHSSPKIENLKRIVKPGTLQELSLSMRGFARVAASTGLFAASYDNINLVFRAAEQIMGRTDSQENGTCATIFPLWKAAAEQMRIADLDAAFHAAPPLSIDDILLTAAESELMDKCLRHCILRIIVEHGGEHFKRFCDDVQNAQPVTPEKIELHCTRLHPLPAWNINESTIIGNAEVVDAIYTELQVKGLSHWNWIVKILCGDQLSIARLRSLLNIRAGHEGGYSGFGWGVWMSGLFHGKIADMHGFFVMHWGVPHRGTRNPGSLFFHNIMLHRSPILLTSFPPFRVCHNLVFVSLYACILHCLLLVSGKTSLAECADSITSFAQLDRYAALIQKKYANANLVSKLRWERKMAEEAEGVPPGDQIFENVSLLLRDALISREFTDSIKARDSGRVVLVLKVLALSFRGNGRSKYAYEMMHLIHNLTHVWLKPIRNIVLNNWLVNPTGKPFSWVEVDLMQEHMNFWIKTIYQAHGSAASWEWLGTKHAPTNLSADIELLMGSLAEHEVYEIKGRVFADGDGSPTPDVITDGIQQITDNTSNPLTEHNAALLKLQARRRLRPLVSTWSDVPESMPEATSSVPPPLPSDPPGSSVPFVLSPADVEMSDVDDETSENGSHGSVDPNEELLTVFERTIDEVDEPTLTRDNADDVALDMDGGDTGFIFNSQLDMDTELDLAGFIADDTDDMDYVDSY